MVNYCISTASSHLGLAVGCRQPACEGPLGSVSGYLLFEGER